MLSVSVNRIVCYRSGSD